jgi:peptidoglycan/LPS O-acetylase OafA/YrhL
MMAWHAEVSWVKGGFARMTIFFVLAGFLAARSVLSARDRGVRHPFLHFWGRRARRLFPVTALGVAAAVAATWGWGGHSATESLAGDTLSALTSWSNWRFVAESRSYGAMLEHPSALQHYWSLSLEEQAFVALPAVLAVCAVVGRHRWRARAAVVATFGVVLCALPLWWQQSPDTVYYGTHTRGGEFLIGAALALWWRGRGEAGPMVERSWRWAGAAGLALLVTVMLTLDRSAEWLYRGGMGLFAVPAAAVVGAVLVGGGAADRVLSVLPLRTIGRWAFPIYTLHWPIFIALDQELAAVQRWQVVLVEVAVSVAVGGVVHVWYERPLMPGAAGRPARVWARPAFAAPVAVVAGVAIFATSTAVPLVEPPVDFDAASAAQPSLSAEEVDAILDGPAPAPGLTEEEASAVLAAETAGTDDLVFRLDDHRATALFGGSTALTLAMGSGPWVEATEGHQSIPGYAALGCGLLTTGERGEAGVEAADAMARARPPAECADRARRWAAAARLRSIDVAVVVASQMDLVEWRLDGDRSWRTVGDPVIDAALERELRETVEMFRSVGVGRVAVTTAVFPPDASLVRGRRVDEGRARSYDRVVRRVASDVGVDVIDLGDWTRSLDHDEFLECFPDTWHPAERCAERIWTELIGPVAVQPPAG